MALSQSLQDAVNAVTAALHPMPEGYYVEGDEKNGCVLVCSRYPEPDGLGFAITAREIAEGDYTDIAVDSFGDLMKAVDTAMRTKNGAEVSIGV